MKFIFTFGMNQKLPSGREAAERYIFIEAANRNDARMDIIEHCGQRWAFEYGYDDGMMMVKDFNLTEVIIDGWADVSTCDKCHGRIVYAMAVQNLYTVAYDADRSKDGTVVFIGRPEGYPLADKASSKNRFGRRDLHAAHGLSCGKTRRKEHQ